MKLVVLAKEGRGLILLETIPGHMDPTSCPDHAVGLATDQGPLHVLKVGYDQNSHVIAIFLAPEGVAQLAASRMLGISVCERDRVFVDPGMFAQIQDLMQDALVHGPAGTEL
jgi:hypothetical protein